ncbi:serine hydrolase domain-containing protein [Hymenobacter chitinivorans]|uniref:CubicO group peptidase (Beta-lactamase class C family) n=1 Tax=Hymenobacter chitinivorans DSM 11115 TaxID=1121954 RepID=A0A2M9B4A9_9BACT|nr:serine hydrolase domain-containing protein [Hymenobacter chitinivorans]PJJ52774.1 CubicO group peptidase (beta-lactamase class C family) [Hymenobacter chitinivorans DSM 11115]
MKKLLALVLGLLAFPALAQTGASTPQLAHCDAAIEQFMKRWKIPGASVAISRQGKLVYCRAFGYADLARTEPMRPSHLLRVASVSKPVTATAIMKLVEEGRIDLQHKAFGPEGYLQSAYYSSAIQDGRIYDITVQQLLEHSAGWNRNNGVDGYNTSDPIDFPLHVADALSVPNPVGDSTMVRFLLSKGLDFKPGARYAYSNVGYLVLGKILEQVTRQPYEAWVQQHILAPAGIHEAHLGRNLLVNKAEREAEYFSKDHRLSCYGNGKEVPAAYGSWNIEAMNAHGGWLFTARDLVRFLLATDGNPAQPDVLTPATQSQMMEPSDNNRHYGKGWMVSKKVNWHTGSLDGTASCVAQTADGYTWAILLNSRANPNRFWNDLEKLGWECVEGATEWPTQDFFPPAQNAAALRSKVTEPTAASLRWTNGNGSRRLVVVREGSPVETLPHDGTSYAADAAFGHGSALSKGTYVVAASPDSAVTIRNLTPNKTYYARVVEYFQNDTTGQQAMYALDGNPTWQFHTPAAPSLLAKLGRTSGKKSAATSRPTKSSTASKAAGKKPLPATKPAADDAAGSQLSKQHSKGWSWLKWFARA